LIIRIIVQLKENRREIRADQRRGIERGQKIAEGASRNLFLWISLRVRIYRKTRSNDYENKEFINDAGFIANLSE